MNIEQTIKYLSKDPLLHIDMIQSIRRGNAELLQVSNKGVLLYNTMCGAIMMSAEDEMTANQMIDTIDNADVFVAHQSFYIDMIQSKFLFKEKMICHQAVYLNNEHLPEVHKSAVIQQLDERYLSFIMENYLHADDEEYLRERLQSGNMFGAFINGKLAGFIGMHSEESIGMLEVLPEYRRQGIALSLESFMVNRLLAEGIVPSAKIIVSNEASLRLQRKLHFSISDKTLCWMT